MADGKTHYGYIDRYHYGRRREILQNHPEIRNLMVGDPSFKFVAGACTLTQLYVSYWLRDSPLLIVLIFSLFVGCLFDCAICNALHELVHDQAFPGKPLLNKIYGNFVNFGLGWPAIAGYYRSHRNHHAYLGTDLDNKYPSIEEAKRYDYSMWTRIVYIFSHPLSMGERWNNIATKLKEQPTQFMVWNYRTVWAFNLLWISFVGWRSYLYLFVAFWINDCVFIQGSKNFADHWVDDQMPYARSYYGPLNHLNFNIGYHREHHDFPNVPGRYLKLIPSLAPKYYSDPRFRTDSLFGDVIAMLRAPYGQGIMKHANKLSVKMAEHKEAE